MWFYGYMKAKILGTLMRLLPEKNGLKIYLYNMRRKSAKRLKQRTLLRFEVNVTDHCNLNCISCTHFSPLSEEKYIDVEVYERDCAQLGKLLNEEMEDIHLMGGEPLLHPQLNKIIEITRKYFVKGVVEIVTNGILLMKQDKSFWETCRKNDVLISVTQYPIKLNYCEIEKLAKNNNVKYRYYSYGKKTMFKIPFDLDGQQNIEETIKMCMMANTCIQLKEGKLFTCNTMANIDIFNKYFSKNLNITEKDYIDIYKVKDKNEIFSFLNKPVPFCRYCNISGTTLGMDWKQSRKEINEWV
jgi:molybdenum cofactor biosynthesis enzyme MoaA